MDLAKYVFKKGVDYLSIYAFSTENFGRSEEEVTYLMGLIIKFFNERSKELDENNINDSETEEVETIEESKQEDILEETDEEETNE